MHAPLCGRFYLYSVDLACYVALIRAKSFTNCDAHLVKSLFRTRSKEEKGVKYGLYVCRRRTGGMSVLETEKKKHVLWKIFISTLYLSTFTFGGGYVIVTLMKKKFVDDYHWIEENEMLDLVAIAQSAPGPIAVNGAIVVGYKLAGLAGTLVAIIGTIIPPFVIISLISAFYHAFRDNYLVSQMLEGMQAGVGAVIASVTYEMGCGIIKKKDNVATIVMIAAFIAACVLGINVIYIVIASGVFGVIRTIWNRRRKRV